MTAPLLLVKDNLIIGEFYSYYAIALELPISINLLGEIFLNNEKQIPLYQLEGQPSNKWTSQEAIIDWVKCYLNNSNLGYKIYRLLM